MTSALSLAEFLLVLLSSLHVASAWLLQQRPHVRRDTSPPSTKTNPFLPCRRSMNFPMVTQDSGIDAGESSKLMPETQSKVNPEALPPLTHNELTWRIRLLPDATPAEQAMWSLQTAKKQQELLKVNDVEFLQSTVWVPDDIHKVVLEAWVGQDKIGRFGFTTRPGPVAPAMLETIIEITGQDNILEVDCQCSAIIFMFVEPQFRKRNVGQLALEVISFIQAQYGAHWTVLVADDKGSGKLVEWYQRHGFSLAPKLQDLFGSPNQVYGITMIGKLQNNLPQNCTIEWWDGDSA